MSTTAEPTVAGVVAPLVYKKGYSPCLSLRFPGMDPERTFDFLLDTGSNFINMDSALVQAYGLPVAESGEMLVARMGSTVFPPGDSYFVGDCELVGVPEQFTFMTGMTASALPCPDLDRCSGRFGVPFFATFPAGVAFQWQPEGEDMPTAVFYYKFDRPEDEGLKRVPLTPLPLDLLSLTINVNGVELPAVLDTGSPETFIIPQAAEAIGMNAEKVGDGEWRSLEPVSIYAGEASLGQGLIGIKDSPTFSNLLGQLAEAGLDPSQVPCAILGLDFLLQTKRMLVRVASNDVWFEELSG